MDPDSEPTVGMREVPIPVSHAELEANRLMFEVAARLLALHPPGEPFPTDIEGEDNFAAHARDVCPHLVLLRKGQKWPADLTGNVALVIPRDGAAMLMMANFSHKEIEWQMSFGEGMTMADGFELLAVRRDGTCEVGFGDLASSLMADVPERESPGEKPG